MKSGIKRITMTAYESEANELLSEGWVFITALSDVHGVNNRLYTDVIFVLGSEQAEAETRCCTCEKCGKEWHTETAAFCDMCGARLPEPDAAPERKFLFMRDGKDAPEGIEWGEGVRPIRYIPGMCACVARHLMHMESAKADAVSVQYDPNDPELDPDAPEFNFEKYEAAVMPILIPKYREADDKANRDFARKELEALRREGLLQGTAPTTAPAAES